MLQGKRIVIVLPRLELGGAERQALQLARFLQHRGAWVEICGLGHPGKAIELCEAYGVPWRLTPVPWPPNRWRKLNSLANLVRTLRQVHPDVLLPYTMEPNVFCGAVWHLSGARVCIWNQRDGGLDFTGARIERFAARQTPCFISNSRHGAEYLVQRFGIDPVKTHVIYNGVELSPPVQDRGNWRKSLGLAEDSFVVCMVANLHAFKDHVTLLKAWRRVVDDWDCCGTPVLLLAGRFDNTHETLKSLAYDLELGRSVRFLGAVDDVSGLLHSVDIGVHSSKSEGCPNGLLECMAAGLPVVATDIPGVREAVGPEAYGYLAPCDDDVALASRILDLARDPRRREQLGHMNRRQIQEQFNIGRMCQETEQVILNGLA